MSKLYVGKALEVIEENFGAAFNSLQIHTLKMAFSRLSVLDTKGGCIMEPESAPCSKPECNCSALLNPDYAEECPVHSSGNMCESKVEMADDFGDNPFTCHCELQEGHEGLHLETSKIFIDWVERPEGRCRKWAVVRICWDEVIDPADPTGSSK